MKIVLISSGVLEVPPLGYGGLEMIVADLAICLDRMGHEVYVVAPSESTIGDVPPAGPGAASPNITHIDCGPKNPNAHAWEEQAYRLICPMMESAEFKDAIWHDHSWGKWLYIAKMFNPRLNVCATLHGMIPYEKAPLVEKPCMIGLSMNHAAEISRALKIQTRHVYNGIDLDRYTFNPETRAERYLFLGRITAFKGPHVFVELMNQENLYGDVVGDDILVEDQNYVSHVKEMCLASGGRVVYHGGVPRERAAEFFRNARAYISPLVAPWSEPFGLTVVESQAAGTPVLGTRNGALPELILHCKTGYLANEGLALEDYLPVGMDTFDPVACRTQAEHFSREAMARGYLGLYEEILENGGW